ncbi:hypothetical protein KJE00_18700, partial [Escherichia marmotae]|nr:hypothetical protein [Escherichia marmotae]
MNQKWIALIISVLTPPSIISGVASIILWSYFSRLDRLDVFFDVINIENVLTLIYFASVFSLFLMILAFLSNSIFISLIIPQDINNLPSYNDGIKKNLIYILASSPLIMIITACLFGFAPIFPDTCYHLTHYWLAAVDIPVASDNPVHYADAIRYNAR